MRNAPNHRIDIGGALILSAACAVIIALSFTLGVVNELDHISFKRIIEQRGPVRDIVVVLRIKCSCSGVEQF